MVVPVQSLSDIRRQKCMYLFRHLTVIKQPTVRGNSSSCIRSYAFVVDGYLTSQGIWNSAKLANFGGFDDDASKGVFEWVTLELSYFKDFKPGKS